MPQTSVAYAAARVYARAKGGLDAGRAERMISAQNAEGARRVLVESGLLSADGQKEPETMADERLRDACELVKRLTPCPEATDCFLLRYDGMNLKMLLKARTLKIPADALSGCGVIGVQSLRHAVADRKYDALPSTLQCALNGLEAKLAVLEDPFLIDRVIDQAVYTLIQEKLKRVRSLPVRRYFSARADMLNAIMLLRARRMKRDAAFFLELLLPGGSVSREAWNTAYSAPEKLPTMLSSYRKGVRETVKMSVSDANKLPFLEKEMENALLAPFLALKGSVYRIEPLIGYLLGAEREATAIRLILAGHANGLKPDLIRERVGDLYGG